MGQIGVFSFSRQWNQGAKGEYSEIGVHRIGNLIGPKSKSSRWFLSIKYLKYMGKKSRQVGKRGEEDGDDRKNRKWRKESVKKGRKEGVSLKNCLRSPSDLFIGQTQMKQQK